LPGDPRAKEDDKGKGGDTHAKEDDKGKGGDPQAKEGDKGKGGTGCQDDTTALEPSVNLEVAPPLEEMKITKTTVNGISVALLAIANGIAIASDGKGGLRVAQNIQPYLINRELLDLRVKIAF